MTALTLRYPPSEQRPGPQSGAGLAVNPGAGVDWSRWVECNEAARLLGEHPGTLRRRCPDLAKRGDARKMTGRGDQRERWWINRSYDLKLAPGKAGEAHQLPDLSIYSEKQVNLAMQRVACVKSLWVVRAGELRAQRFWMPGLVARLREDYPDVSPSERSLRRWDSIYRDPADLVKLIDTRGGNTRGEPDPACWDLFRQLYLTQDRRRIRKCWKRVKAKARADGLTWCSYTQLLRLVRRKISPSERSKYRRPDEYRSKHSDYIDMDPETWAPGVCWQGDHCVLDVWCTFQGKTIRPWLSAWMDWRTRKIVGWVLCDTPNSSTVLTGFARAVRDESNQGGPDIVYLDNGKDYKCESFVGGTAAQIRKAKKVFSGQDYDLSAFKGLYSLLSIDTIFAIPRNSRAKGRIEVWFDHWLHQDFDKFWPTYAGNSPETRPTGLTAKLKDGRETPTFQEVRERLARHIEIYNQSRDHCKDDLDGFSPAELMQTARRRMFADPGVLDRFLLTYSKPVRVRRHRVTANVLGSKGLVYKSHDARFAELNGRDEYFRVGYDQDDVGRAILFDDQLRPVCNLYQVEFGQHATTTVKRRHLSKAMSTQRKLNHAHKTLVDHERDSTKSLEELALDEALKDIDPTTPESIGGEQPTKLIHTPADGYVNDHHRLDLKQAAGAETCSDNPEPPRRLADPSDFMESLEGPGYGLEDEPDEPVSASVWTDGELDDLGDDHISLSFSDYTEGDFDQDETKPEADVSDYLSDGQGVVW